MKLVLMSLVLALAAPAVSGATQTPQQNGPSASAPAFVRLDGEFKAATGEARSGSVVVVISLYGRQDDTAPLWTETQAVTLDAAGRYTVFAGATQPEGLPRELFAVNAAQWIGVALQGEPEQPRVRMVSVPYALSAGNADTLGGVPVKDFVMTENLAESVKKALTGDEAKAAARDGDPTTMGTSGRIAKFDGSGHAGEHRRLRHLRERRPTSASAPTPPGQSNLTSPRRTLRQQRRRATMAGFIDGLNIGTWDMFGYPAPRSFDRNRRLRGGQWTAIVFTSGRKKFHGSQQPAASASARRHPTPQLTSQRPDRRQQRGVAVSDSFDGFEHRHVGHVRVSRQRHRSRHRRLSRGSVEPRVLH